jgi:hypothetical protein
MAENASAAEKAYETIVGQLAAPYFFQKLAAAGIEPESEKEAASMWEAAHKLHVLYGAEQEKVASEKASALDVLNKKLDERLGHGDSASVSEKSAAFNDVAALAADDPAIANAVLTLQAAAAEAQAAE